MNDSEKTVHIAPPPRIEKAGLFVLTMLGLFLLAEAIGGFQNLGGPGNPPTNTITVSGTGKAAAVPDIAHITFSVTQTAATVAEAQAAATKQSNAALAYLKDQGIDDKDVRTSSYNISPQYSYPRPCTGGMLCPVYENSTPKITGYQVSETIEVTVHDLDKTGTLLAGLGSQNVQNLYGPEFALDNPAAPQEEARAKAIADAKAQAELLARQLGVHLGKVVSFSEGGGGYPYPMYGMGAKTMAADSVAVAPQVPTGQNEYNSNVSITYEIR